MSAIARGNDQNLIGDHGEDVAKASFSRPVQGRALFRATHLGGKYPVVDLLVDILDASFCSIGFFFVQVKTTSRAHAKSKSLRLKIDLEKYNLLARIPIPTYIVGVDTSDVQDEKVYIVAARRPLAKTFSAIRKDFDLSLDAVRVNLHKEVANYWRRKKNRVSKIGTEFKNER